MTTKNIIYANKDTFISQLLQIQILVKILCLFVSKSKKSFIKV